MSIVTEPVADTSATRRSFGLALACVLVPLLALKLLFNPSPLGDLQRDDGAFYYQVARHVAEGDGLQTSVSLYHWGLEPLPHQTFSYPLWTLVLGAAGRVTDLATAAHLLPEALYFATLIALYGLARRVAEFWGNADHVLLPGGIRLNAGHMAVLLFGFNPVFFEFTSLPFAEGLTFSLAFGAFLLLSSFDDSRRPVARGVVLGVVGALAFLARSQMIGLPLSIAAALALVGWRDRTYRRAALACALASMTVMAGWVLHVFASIEHFTPAMLIDHTRVHESAALLPHLWLVKAPSILATVTGDLEGLLTAFNPASRFSYFRSFGPMAYLVPFSAVILVADRKQWGAMTPRLTTPPFALAAAVVTCGLTSLLPVHLMHAFRWGGWFFQFRHGLPLIFLLIVATPYLMNRHRMTRAIVLILLAGSVVMNGYQVARVMAARHAEPTEGQHALGKWIDDQPRVPLLLSAIAAPLGALTRGSFHWIACDDSGAQTRTYFKDLNVDYLVTLEPDRACPFFSEVKTSLHEVQSFGTADDRLTLWSFTE